MKVYIQQANLPKTRQFAGEVPDRLKHWQAVALDLELNLDHLISGRKVHPRFDPESFWLLVTYHR